LRPQREARRRNHGQRQTCNLPHMEPPVREKKEL
jgi:hypothetical protein